MATPYSLVSRDAQLALTEFSTEFDAALAVGSPDLWSSAFGHSFTSRAIKTTYPIPVSAAGYVKRQGDDKMRDLFERSASVVPFEWVDGVSARAAIVEAPDFVGWVGEPGRIAVESLRLLNILAVTVLEGNAVLDFDGLSLFNAAHPVNVFDASLGTFSNVVAGPIASIAVALPAALTRFRQKKGPNGKPMGLRVTDVIVPSGREQEAKSFLQSDLMYAATLAQGSNTQQTTNNIYKGAVNLVVADELTSANDIYFLDRNGPPPYVIQDGGAPEEITYDKDSDMYKDTGKIGKKFVKLAGYAGLLPHAIEKVTLS
jgi:hypothetical protein